MTARIVAEAASAAAAEVAMFNDARRDEELFRVRQGQTESAGIVAQEALEQKYGKDEFERLLPKLTRKLEQSPNLVPPEVFTSPTGLARALDDALKIVSVEDKAEEDANHWQKVKANNASVPRVWR